MNTETEKLRQRWPFGLFLAGGTKEPPALFRVTAQSVCRRGRYCAGGGSLSRKARERETDEIGGISKKKKNEKKKKQHNNKHPQIVRHGYIRRRVWVCLCACVCGAIMSTKKNKRHLKRDGDKWLSLYRSRCSKNVQKEGNGQM